MLPPEYIKSVEEGIREASRSGSLGGYEVVDFSAKLVDGSVNELESCELAYKIAGSLAFREACEKGGSVLLEPFMKCEIVVPDEFLDGIQGNGQDRTSQIPIRQDRQHCRT